MTDRSILFATDLSCRTDRALDRSTMLAREWGARLVVVHVVSGPDPVTDLPSWREPQDPLEVAWRRVRADVQDVEGIDIDVLVERGEPSAVVLEKIDGLAPELVVTGVARDEALGRMTLGGTVEKLVRASTVPVLVVKSRPRVPYRNVVVATDFSEGSRNALEAALELFPESRLTVFHAYEVPYETLLDDRMAAREAVARHVREECQAFLDATPAVAASGRSIEQLCEYGEASALLHDLVQVREIDLVVLGTQGRSGLAQMLLGSVAERLLVRLPVDVMVVRRRRG
jgi:nucleotide-binding universal stress UspA family protein